MDAAEAPVRLSQHLGEGLHAGQSGLVGIPEGNLLHGRETLEKRLDFSLIFYLVNHNLALRF